jgi:hypothetical protein
MLDQGVVALLLDLSATGDTAILSNVVIAIMNLSLVDAVGERERMVEQGVVTPLLSLVRVCTPKYLVKEGSTVLGDAQKLTIVNNYEGDRVGSSSGDVTADELVDKKFVAAAAASLRNLARDESVREALASRWQITSVLVDLVQHNQQHTADIQEPSVAEHEAQDSESVVRSTILGYSTGALVNLALEPLNAEELLRCGAVAPLVRFCLSSTDPGVLQYATQALAILARHEPSRLVLLEHGAVYPLVQVCAQPQKLPSVVVGYAAATLANLGLHPVCADVLVSDGAVAPLLALLTFRPEEEEGIARVDTVLVGYAAAAIRNLAGHDSCRGHLIESEVARPLLELCKTECVLLRQEAEGREVGAEDRLGSIGLRNVLMALANIALAEQTKSSLLEGGVVWFGGIKILIALLKRSADDGVLSCCLGVLAHIASASSARPVLSEERVLTPVVQLLCESADTQVLANAAECVRNMARHPGIRLMILKEAAVLPLVQLLKQARDGVVLSNVAAALANLALEAKARPAICQGGGIPPLIRVCLSASQLMRRRKARRTPTGGGGEGRTARQDPSKSVDIDEAQARSDEEGEDVVEQEDERDDDDESTSVREELLRNGVACLKNMSRFNESREVRPADLRARRIYITSLVSSCRRHSQMIVKMGAVEMLVQLSKPEQLDAKVRSFAKEILLNLALEESLVRGRSRLNEPCAMCSLQLSRAAVAPPAFCRASNSSPKEPSTLSSNCWGNARRLVPGLEEAVCR